ncbi:MAG: mechanosensitive ion channel family protein [Bdellovibrionaceae bacterium]|jgi:small-conductance mechanosensitive channel|nr:mechanosensitive ion channel family protein [Pseudobdellovibrionaceae bacterium]
MNKLIQTQALAQLLEIEPYTLLGLLLFVTYLFYRFFLRDASEERHKNIQNHFANITRHFLVLSLLFFTFLILNEVDTEWTHFRRIAPYVGLVTLLWGMIVFVKTCRLIVLQYLFMSSMQTGVPLLLVNIFSLLLSIVLVFWTASHVFGVQLAPLLATSAAFSIILGLALQDTLGNLFAGIAMQVDKTFEIGDWVEVVQGSQKTVGKVKELTWRSTIMDGFFDEVITIPNRVMAQAQVYNFSPKETPIVRSVIFRMAHGVNPDKVKEVLEGSIAGLSDIRGIPSPLCFISESNENHIAFKLVYNIDNYGSQYILADKVYRRGFEALEAQGLRMARPYIEYSAKVPTDIVPIPPTHSS